MTNGLNIIVIGLGHQALEDHLPAIVESNKYNLVGVVDIDRDHAVGVSEKYNTEYAVSVSEMLSKLPFKPDVALIATPHSAYLEIIEELTENKINIIKEKPFATSVNEALRIIDLIKKSNVSIFVTLQRRFNPIFASVPQLIKKIGVLYAIEAKYTMNISKLDSDWRANSRIALGGHCQTWGIILLTYLYGTLGYQYQSYANSRLTIATVRYTT